MIDEKFKIEFYVSYILTELPVSKVQSAGFYWQNLSQLLMSHVLQKIKSWQANN